MAVSPSLYAGFQQSQDQVYVLQDILEAYPTERVWDQPLVFQGDTRENSLIYLIQSFRMVVDNILDLFAWSGRSRVSGRTFPRLLLTISLPPPHGDYQTIGGTSYSTQSSLRRKF